MNWHKYDIKDSATHPDKDKYLIVKMNTGEHWTGCYCGNGYWIIYRIDESYYSINYNKYDDISCMSGRLFVNGLTLTTCLKTDYTIALDYMMKLQR